MTDKNTQTESALEQANAILAQANERELTESDGKALEALERFIDADIFGDLWAAYVTASDLNYT